MKTMKTNNRTSCLTLLAIAVALLLTGSPARASDTDERIESSAMDSYMFKTYLKDDAINDRIRRWCRHPDTGRSTKNSISALAERDGSKPARREKC